MPAPTNRTRGAIAIAIALCAALVPASAAAKKSKAFEETKVVNAAVPNAVSAALTSQIEVPKKYKRKVVGDVNVTGLQTTGSGAGAAADLRIKLTAPNGRTVWLVRQVGFQSGTPSFGPWTLDDDTPISICDTPPGTSCPNPLQSLYAPFAGTSNLVFNDGPSVPPLTALNGVKMKGTWTLSVVDPLPGAQSSTLNQWGLKIKAAKPVTS